MIRYIIIAGLMLIGLFVKSQVPVANFTSNAATGCSPVVVDFKDASTGDPKFWNWDFGNGQLSNIQNPQVVYYNPGTYSVTLVVRNANGTNGITKTDFITVNPSPRAEFTSNYTSVCMPASIQFLDQSQTSGGTLSNWEWDFGDGTTSILQNPVKLYSSTGYYTVSLKITSSSGCTHITSKTRYIRVLPGVLTAFKDPVAQVCKPPYNLIFNNESSGPGNLTYSWNFGNGSTSTDKDPSLTVTTSASLNVQLIAKSDLGCSDTVNKVVKINSTLTTINSPDSACLNTPVAFQNTSTIVPLTSKWTFSDGITSQQVNTSRTFTAPGTYNVKLVNSYQDCTDSITKTIKIPEPPTVDFTSNIPGACKAPTAINFQDISPNAVSWQWDFGDGGTSNQKAPAHSYTREGEFDVSLTITNSNGCKNTLKKTKFIRITPPVVQIANAPVTGCVPFQFSPVPNVDAVDGVTSYLWDFGVAGSTSTQPNPTYTYTNPGNYTLKLSVTTTGGCTGSVTLTDGIKTGLPSNPAFSSDIVQTCSDSPIQFNNLSTPAGITYSWDFGDGTTSTLTNPSHRYVTPGSYSVSLTTSNNGCLNTITKPAYITVQPPIAKFTYRSDCNALPLVTFTNTSIIDNTKPVSYAWEFGDPANGSSTEMNPVYQFPSKATYNVRLTVTNGNCVNSFFFPVSLATQISDFSKSPSDSVCRNQNLTLTAVNSNPQNISNYQWALNGGPFNTAGNSLVTTFNQNGNIPLTLAITDLGGCSDTVTKFITVIGSQAYFAPSDSVACENSLISFIDQSTPAGSVSQWKFDYGDGTTQTYTRGPFTHLYKNAGSYGVSLTITSKDGCSDAVWRSNLIRISKPIAAFSSKDTLLCPGGVAQFTDSSRTTGPLSYLWNFGDGTTSTQQHPLHIYSGKDNVYNVSLKIQDMAGCSDSLSKANYIKTTSPISAFTISDSTTICPPLQIEFLKKGSGFTTYYWDFGDNTTSTLDTPIHFYNSYGRYVARLFVTGAGGCVDSSEHIINVNDPYTSVISYSPLIACNSLLVDFTIKKPENTFYTFYFGDGSMDVSQKDSLQHFYNTPNGYGPYMELGDSSGCRVYVGGTDQIKVLGAEPFFSPDRKSFCDSGTVYFTNYTIANDPVISSLWDFGDGATSTEKDPIHNYNQPGRFIVSLSVNTQSGCSKTITDTIRVYRTPAPSIDVDSVDCINSPVNFKVVLTAPDSTLSYTWNFGNGTTSNLVSPSVIYAKEGSYTVSMEATNILGCKGSDSKNIVIEPLPQITAPSGIVIPVGIGITVPITYSQNAESYNWTPASGLSCTNCATPFAVPKINTDYTVTVTDSNGCVNSAKFTIAVVCNEKNYFVPNTFSPNGDGNNDVFFPRGNGINKVQSMRIFNRWGEMIFEKKNFSANNPSEGWNGTMNGKTAPTDVFVYIIEFICENNTIIPFKGNVTLIR